MPALVPARPGADFAKLWTASAVSNIGDGITMAAGPLLVAAVTTDPAAIAGAVFVQQLPWLLFALISGAYVDRLDRRRLIVVVNLLRAAALAALTAAVATDRVVPPHLLGRVGSAYALLDLGGAALGSLLGGGIAHQFGVAAPYWIAAGVMTVIAALAWRPLGTAPAG